MMYKKLILSFSGSDSVDSLVKSLGREPNYEAYFRMNDFN